MSERPASFVVVCNFGALPHELSAPASVSVLPSLPVLLSDFVVESAPESLLLLSSPLGVPVALLELHAAIPRPLNAMPAPAMTNQAKVFFFMIG
jgi:hypothetical protein